MVNREDITGLVLAGGEGRRVGGRDKGLQQWQGQPLIAHVTERIRPQVAGLIISCNRNAERYRQYSNTTIADHRSDFQGPLAGIEAAAASITSAFVLVVPCDTPQLPVNLVARLAGIFPGQEDRPVDICYAHDGMQAQYLCALIRRECIAMLGVFMDSGQRAVRDWYSQHYSLAIDFSDQAECFHNYNRLP